MIFPQDVNRVIVNSKKIDGDNKTKLIGIVAFFGIFIVGYLVDVFISGAIGAGFGVTIAIVAVIGIVIGFFIFRFVIFDEREKKREFLGQESDSFAKYMFLRNDIHTDFVVDDTPITIFEFTNGSSVAVIEFRFGSNDDVKAKKTRDIYEHIIHAAAVNGVESRCIVGTEDFRTSEEFRRHVRAINAIENKEAAKSVMRINDAIISSSCKKSHVDVVYVMLRTKGGQQRHDLELTVRSAHTMMSSVASAFRTMKFLDGDELMAFFRYFYGIEAIDLSMMRAMSDAENCYTDSASIVEVYQIETESGKKFKTEKEYFSVGEQRLN